MIFGILAGIIIAIAAIWLPWFIPNRTREILVVDVLEINTLIREDGSKIMDQCILWREHLTQHDTRLHVAQWFKLAEPAQVRQRSGPFREIVAKVNGKQYTFHARTYRRTMEHLRNDPETIDAETLPRDRRRPYF